MRGGGDPGKYRVASKSITIGYGLCGPGRSIAADRDEMRTAGTNRRAGMETTDWHELEEHRFIRGVAEAMTKLVHEGKVEALIVAAPARTLATLRKALHADVKSRIIAEI